MWAASLEVLFFSFGFKISTLRKMTKDLKFEFIRKKIQFGVFLKDEFQ